MIPLLVWQDCVHRGEPRTAVARCRGMVRPSRPCAKGGEGRPNTGIHEGPSRGPTSRMRAWSPFWSLTMRTSEARGAAGLHALGTDGKRGLGNGPNDHPRPWVDEGGQPDIVPRW